MGVGFIHRSYAYPRVLPGCLVHRGDCSVPRGPLAWWFWVCGQHLKEMTLGNGYLGSRYDEERSEMRYLV